MALVLHRELYIRTDSSIHRWAVRPKLLSLLSLMFAVALISHVAVLPLALLGVLILYGMARLPLVYLWQRLAYPGLFILAMVAVLPWVSGETVLWQGGWLSLRLEGLTMAGLVIGRFLAILITGFILLGTTPFLDILKALRSLGLPSLLTDMTLLTYRYLYDIAEQLATMQQAMGLRGYGYRRQTIRQRWRWLAALLGTLLLRSYERSQRVYKAMRLRGYSQINAGLPSPDRLYRTSPTTLIATGFTLGFALSLVLAEIMMSRL
jgi:cobalt/nickel transport system permease protein